MKLRLIRHATLWLEYGGNRFLVDPMLSDPGANPPIPRTANPRNNPLVPLPVPPEELAAPDAVLVTHLHQDHWDRAAAAAIGKEVPVFTQPGSEQPLREAGFRTVLPLEQAALFRGVTLTRTSGRHGTGDIGAAMGPVSGFVLQAPGEPVLYIAGDTIWCGEVASALDTFRPALTVVNAGGARFLEGDPITMDGAGIAELCRYAPYTRVAAVHLEAINHCHETRSQLRDVLAHHALADRVAVPQDGEWFD
ncbi:MBL fold metallo-hydrolase [Gorillibacterium sp. sgz5001074]|uniref:MBL fold metallo-hydrolase n=1 Tax=Gorillibacterium sp. sgz5001074 TaxID=3446695 RepID=UPI003F66D997